MKAVFRSQANDVLNLAQAHTPHGMVDISVIGWNIEPFGYSSLEVVLLQQLKRFFVGFFIQHSLAWGEATAADTEGEPARLMLGCHALIATATGNGRRDIFTGRCLVPSSLANFWRR